MATLSLRVLQREAKAMNLDPVPDYWRPKTRADCIDLPRPCPYVGCRHHLMIEPKKGGGLKFYAESPDQMPETCSLDMADEGGKTLEEIADIMGITRERVRQIEEMAKESFDKRIDYLEGCTSEDFNTGFSQLESDGLVLLGT